MANINLLPWREAQRRERNRTTMIAAFALWAAAALMVLLGKAFMDGRIEHQENRNIFLQTEINALSTVIAEIENLKEKRDALLARMQVIQTLQANRSQIVHVFDDLVTKLPKGVYYDSITKLSGMLVIEGKAQSNGRVSALMRNLDSSDWFDNTSLKVVDVIDDNGALVSKFNVEVKEERQSATDDVENIR
ncbi:MAG: pilus assembly protein PilN [Gammaproteobacteria bacterium]|nr:pilus assembly protein PilN [Gammaproteobacteria bacterium]